MPRIVTGDTIELHYQSPNEMVTHLAGVLDSHELIFETTSPPKAGMRPEVVVHIPWLGQTVRLRGRVTRVEGRLPAARVHLRLEDGPHDTLGTLREFMGKFKSGAILEESHDATGDGAVGQSPEQRIRAMSPSLRAMLAAKANAEERMVLSRDPDPRVIEFLLKNPSLTIEEARRIAGRLNLHQGHFSQISRNPVWMADEPVRTALARNPRLPEFMAETVLTTLPTALLKNLAESMNTTAATRRVAGRVLQSRGITVAARRNY